VLSTEERADLRDSVRSLLARYSGEDDVRRVMSGPPGGVDEELWSRLGELGLHAATVPEDLGGLGAAIGDLAVVLEETGRSLACVPLLSTLHATAALRAIQEIHDSPDPGAARALLSGIADGSARVALVHDPGRRHSRTAQVLGADDWEVYGTARHVVDGFRATHVLVPALAGDTEALFLVEAEADRLTRSAVGTLDQTRQLAEISFVHTPAVLLATGDGAVAVREAAENVAATALGAECVGGAEKVLAMTTEHGRTRMQFGRPVGSFQAVKHLCADMLVQLELARTAAAHAAATLDDPASSRIARGDAVLLARAQCADAYYRCASIGLQVHGGIGFTWEHPLHLYLKRAKSSQQLLGSSAQARRRIAARLGLSVS
jgi:alkylation response protein AidB-like acyl-CoA dehydrogenase